MSILETRLASAEMSIFVCAASASDSKSTFSDSHNCSTVIDIETGFPVIFYCNTSCATDGLVRWFYYPYSQDSANTKVEVLHNGEHNQTVHPRWSSRGVSVVYNLTAAFSVLKIQKVMLNVSGVYECSTGRSDGCSKRLCLRTGKQLTLHNLL